MEERKESKISAYLIETRPQDPSSFVLYDGVSCCYGMEFECIQTDLAHLSNTGELLCARTGAVTVRSVSTPHLRTAFFIYLRDKSAGMDGIQSKIIITCLMILKLPMFEMSSGKVLEETYRKWVQYKEDCVKMIENEPLLQGGLFCNRTFDRYACWPDTPAGTSINISCPFYLPWYDKVSQGVVQRRCGSDGLWERDQHGQVWRDMTQCEEEKEVMSQELWFKQLMVSFRMLYTVGYSLSLFTLITALIILLSFRKLHCTRNYIHANLFLSLILRAVSIIAKDTMLERHWGREIMKQTDVREMLSHQAAVGCRIAQVMMQYCVLANHYWFFGEAIYLHSVLIASVFIDNNKYLPYICLGWGTPLVFVVPWAVMKLLNENKECWAVNENMNYWWIIRFPILLASLISFLIFMKILKVILSKLRASNQTGYPDYKLRQVAQKIHSFILELNLFNSCVYLFKPGSCLLTLRQEQ
ncbi:glucagon-like peptide 1 receptor [Xyrichtys novacula]|uniref:Glucagon-like peptide 1 receptor n=1 Tax=Xyrichtys novacula TaxID=13765 RepID=A0AAV1H4A6_XYRNO|nr:glucagon-like peptide 1 receptor [Xyrichtys novacula]